ncbi:hypothetical protein JOA01_06320 [Streptococcus parasuis]|uniref:hypothetical protein n=1 Tax=Streptococcus parasuis TaxID=1501662 RepID=UPI001C2C5250|nr:hypothetical protein [Streptococcus parasuis]MBV1943212.1 hypothetical protein [Streptococcus parasuis]QXF04941.1 hypothetical protein JOA01_06320 [Streptococcus parasuis]
MASNLKKRVLKLETQYKYNDDWFVFINYDTDGFIKITKRKPNGEKMSVFRVANEAEVCETIKSFCLTERDIIFDDRL